MKRILPLLLTALLLVGLLGACEKSPEPVEPGIIIFHDDPNALTEPGFVPGEATEEPDEPGEPPETNTENQPDEPEQSSKENPLGEPEQSSESNPPEESGQPEAVDPPDAPNQPEEPEPAEIHVHEFEGWVSEIPPTCATAGIKGHNHCSICQKDFDQDNQEIADLSIPATNAHTEVVDAAVPATCKTTGLTEGKHCSACGKVLVQQEIIPLQHTFGEWINEVPATCTSEGELGHFVCATCGGYFNKNNVKLADLTIPPLAHSYKGGICEVCGDRKPSKGLVFQSLDNGNCALWNLGDCIDAEITVPKTSPSGECVMRIVQNAFSGSVCTKVYLPASIAEIDSLAFQNCLHLTEIVFSGTTEEWNAIEKGTDWLVGSATITCLKP